MKGLEGGTVQWQAAQVSRWGNRCMDVVAPDGRLWSFLTLNWEDQTSHPNLTAVVDWAEGADAPFVGFLDTAVGPFHEAQVILTPTARDASSELASTSDKKPDAADRSLCQALFEEHTDHTFFGTGHATEPGKSPGYLELELKPSTNTAEAIELGGHLVATKGPRWMAKHPLDPSKSACLDLPDRRYSMLQLVTERGAELILWLYSDDGAPHKRDRLIGYVTFPGSAIERSKVALWRL